MMHRDGGGGSAPLHDPAFPRYSRTWAGNVRCSRVAWGLLRGWFLVLLGCGLQIAAGGGDPFRLSLEGRSRVRLEAAWYEREIEVPSSWKDRVVTLHLERVVWRSEAWIDGEPAGSADSLATPHEHPLGRLSPGRHRVTLRIDNRMQHNLSTITHAYGSETQTRWNGAVGRLELRARVPVALTRLEIHPAPDRRSVRVAARVSVPEGRSGEGILRFQLEPGNGTRVLARSEQAVRSGPGEARVGAGRLLVCSYDLETDLEGRHAARQFRNSLLQYLESTAFWPTTEFGYHELGRILGGEEEKGAGKP